MSNELALPDVSSRVLRRVYSYRGVCVCVYIYMYIYRIWLGTITTNKREGKRVKEARAKFDDSQERMTGCVATGSSHGRFMAEDSHRNETRNRATRLEANSGRRFSLILSRGSLLSSRESSSMAFHVFCFVCLSLSLSIPDKNSSVN